MGCSLRTCVSLYAHSGRMYPPMLTMYLCIPAILTTDLCILLCSLWTCISLCAHYGPAFPSVLTTVTPIYITGHRKPNPHHPAAAPNTTHTTHYAHHTPKMATSPPVVSNHTPTLLLPHLTYIVYTPSHLPPYTKAQSLTPRRQTCARAVSQTTVTATCPHCSYPDCTQLRPDHHTLYCMHSHKSTRTPLLTRATRRLTTHSVATRHAPSQRPNYGGRSDLYSRTQPNAYCMHSPSPL